MPLFYKIVRPLIKVLFRVAYRPTVIGLENIPKNGPYILVGNHTNNFDCLLLISTIKEPIHFLAKHTLLEGPKKYIFKGMGIIPVDRTKKTNKEATNEAKRVLENGEIVAIFPEGTINRTEEVIMPFKMGAVAIANSTHVPLLPFSIKGKYKLFKNDLRIEFSKSYYVENSNLDKENEKLMDIVSKMLKEKKS